MKPTNQLTLENAKLFLNFDSRVEEDVLIKKTVFGYRTQTHFNNFTKPVGTIKCYLLLKDHEPEEINFSIKTGRRKVWLGFLKAGRGATLGINFKVVFTENFHADTNTISYSMDTSISLKEERQISDFARNLFDLPEKDNNDKPRKKSKGKK